jgi:CDP-glucose 4,6-dehydratase
MGAEVFGLALAPGTSPSLHDLLGAPLGAEALGDIRDAVAVTRAFKVARPEVVIHMAAQALVHTSYADPVETFDTNVMGLVRVLEAARVTETVRAVVNVTSDKCYENVGQLWAYRETEPMGGSDPYSASKGCSELITASYRRSFFKAADGARLGSGRAGNVIGGGDWSGDRLVPDCVRAFAIGEPAVIRNPLATRPWQHVLEPIAGYLVLAEALYTRGHQVAEGWNFGPPDEDAWSVDRVVDLIAKLWGDGAAWVQDRSVWPKEAMLLRVDATKARQRLGWRPRLSVSDALSWTVDWYKAVLGGTSALDATLDQIDRYESLAQIRTLG